MASQEIDLNIDLNVDVLSPAQKAQEVEKALRAAEQAANKINHALSNITVSAQMEDSLKSYKQKAEEIKDILRDVQQGIGSATTSTMTMAVNQLREAVALIKEAKSISSTINNDSAAALRAFLATPSPGDTGARMDYIANSAVNRITNLTSQTLAEFTRVINKIEHIQRNYDFFDQRNHNFTTSSELRELIDALNSSDKNTGIIYNNDSENRIAISVSRIADAYKNNDFFKSLVSALQSTQTEMITTICDRIMTRINFRQTNSIETAQFVNALIGVLKSTNTLATAPGISAMANLFTPGTLLHDRDSLNTLAEDFIKEIQSARKIARSLPDLLDIIQTRQSNGAPRLIVSPGQSREDIHGRYLDIFTNMTDILRATQNRYPMENHLLEILQNVSQHIEDLSLRVLDIGDINTVHAIKDAFTQLYGHEPANMSEMSGLMRTRVFSRLNDDERNNPLNNNADYRLLAQQFDYDTARELIERFVTTMAAFPNYFVGATYRIIDRFGALMSPQRAALPEAGLIYNPSSPMYARLSEYGTNQNMLAPNDLRAITQYINRRAEWRGLPPVQSLPPLPPPADILARATSYRPSGVVAPVSQQQPGAIPTPASPGAGNAAPTSTQASAPLITSNATPEEQRKATRLLDLLIDTVHFTRDNLKEMKTITKELIGGDNNAFTNSTLGQMFKTGEGFRKYTDATNIPMYDIVYKNRQSILSETKISEILGLSENAFMQRIFDKEQAKFSNFRNSEYYGHLIQSKQYSMANVEERSILTPAQLTQALKSYYPGFIVSMDDAIFDFIKTQTQATLKDLYDYVQLGIKQMTDHGLPASMFDAARPRIELRSASLSSSGNTINYSAEGYRRAAVGNTTPRPHGRNEISRSLNLGGSNPNAYHSMQVAHAPGEYYDLPGGQHEFIVRQMDLYRKLGLKQIGVSPAWTGHALWPASGYLPRISREWATYDDTKKNDIISTVVDKVKNYFTASLATGSMGMSFNLEGPDTTQYSLKHDGADSGQITDFGRLLRDFMKQTTPKEWFNIGKSGLGSAALNKYSIKKAVDGKKLNIGWAVISALKDMADGSMTAHKFNMAPDSDSIKTLEYGLYEAFKRNKGVFTPQLEAEYAEFIKRAVYNNEDSLLPAAFRQGIGKGAGLRQYRGSITNALRLQERNRVRRVAVPTEPAAKLLNLATQVIESAPTAVPASTIHPAEVNEMTDFLNLILNSSVEQLEVIEADLSGRPLEEIRASRFTMSPGRTVLPKSLLTAMMRRRMSSRVGLLGTPRNSIRVPNFAFPADFSMPLSLGGDNLLSAPLGAEMGKFAGRVPVLANRMKELNRFTEAFLMGESAAPHSPLTADAYFRRLVNSGLLLEEGSGNRYGVPDIYRPRKQSFHEEEKSYSSANREGIVLDFSYLDKSQWANTNNKGYRFGAGLDQNFESAKNLASMYRSFTGKTYDMEYGFVERIGDREFYNPYKARGLYDPASIKEDAFATDRTWKGIIGLTDAEEALGMSSERTQYQLNKQKQITLEKADATKKLSHEIERLSQLEHQLKQNTEATIGFNKTQINNAVSAFTDAGSIRMKRADIGTGTTGAYRDTVLEMHNKAEQQKNVNGIPFWVKDYYKGADGKIYFTKEYAEFESVRNKKLGTTVNKYRNEAGEADYRFRRGLDSNTFNEDLLPRAQAIRRGRFSSMSDLAEMLGYSTSGNPLAYNSKGGVTAFNVLANPKKLASDLERYLGANATVFERLQSDNGLEYITNAYQSYAKHLRGMLYTKNGELKSDEELKKLFTDKQFTDIFLKRLESNIKAFDEQLTHAGIDAATLGLSKIKAETLQEKGRFGTGYETHRMFLGEVGTIVKNLDREGKPIMYGGTEQDYLYRRFGAGSPVPPKTKEQLIREGSQSWITRTFGIAEASTYEGALQNASQYAKQMSDDMPRVLQALNLSYTKAAFAFSRVAYGMRIISMELTAMGRQIYTTFAQGLGYIYKYTDGITKATETQTKARISLTGIFDANRANDMISFARQYAVTSPATFGEITQMMKSFGLTPQIRDMIQSSKNMPSTLKELSYVTVGLGSTKPQQGIEGAMFAIREAMSGQFTSLKRRFEISPDIIASMMGVSMAQMKQSPETFIKGLKKFLDLNVGEDTLQKLSMTYQVQLNNITDFIEQAQSMIGNSGFYDVAVGIANKIADAFANILNIPSFKEKMQTISDYMSITAGSIVTGLGNMASSILPLNNEASVRKDIEAQVLKGNAGISTEELKTRADIGISIMKVTQLLTSGLRLLSEATKGLMGYFEDLFSGLQLNEETLFEYAALIGKIVKAFGDLATSVIKAYLNVAQFVTNSGISRGFQAMFLLFTMFPVASANIVINTFRGLFETILAIYSPQLHSALGGISTHFMQLSGALVNLGKTSISWSAVKEGINAIYNPMVNINEMNKTAIENVLTEKKLLQEAWDEGLINEENFNRLRDEIAKRADILTSSTVIGPWQTKFGKMFSTAAFGARVLVAGALGGLVLFGLTEALSTGDATKALQNTAKRIVGFFAYVNDMISAVFGDGWIGTIARAGGILAIVAPAATWSVAIAGWNMFSAAAIAALTAISAHPAFLALTALIASVSVLTTSDWFKESIGSAGGEVYLKTMKDYVTKANEGRASEVPTGTFIDPDFLNSFTLYDKIRRKQNNKFKNPLLRQDGSFDFKELPNNTAIIADYEKYLKSTGELGKLENLSKIFKNENGLVPPSIIESAEKRGAQALKNLGLSIDDYEKKAGAAATSTTEVAKAMITAANASRNLADNYKTLLGLNLPDVSDPESAALKPFLQKAQSLELLSGKSNEIIERYAKQDKKKELAEIDTQIAKEKELDIQREQNLYGMLVMREMLNKEAKKATSGVDAMYSATTSFNGKIADCYNGLIDTTKASDDLVSSINKLSGVSFNIPVTLMLQISEAFGNLPELGAIPGGGAVNALKQIGSSMKNYIVNSMSNVNNPALKKTAHDIITKNSKIPGLIEAKNQAGAGGEDKASQLKEKYSKMLKDLDKEILEAQGHNIKARIEAAKHEADAKLEEVRREFKGTQYLAELETKIQEAETAKRIKLQKEIKKEAYTDLMNSKYASPDMQMKAYDYIKGEELKSKLTDIKDMVDAKLLSSAEAKSLEELTKYTYQVERLEKQYDMLKNQPKLTELIGGKDADKLIDNLTGNFAKYVTTLDEYNKRVGATTVLTSSYDRILNQTDKSKYIAGDTTYSTTTKTTIDQNKLRSPRGLTNGTNSNTLLAEFANLYEREQLTLLKQEVDQMRQMSELQIARLQQNGQVYGVSVDTVRAMREQVITAKALMEVEELHYKQLERNVKMSNDIKLQMKYAVDEAVRQLPTNYEIVKSATQGMFNTLKEGLSNVLVAGFSRDTEKMKDLWSQLMTDLKTAFFKMAADLIVKGWMEKIFGNFFPNQEKEKQQKQDATVSMLQAGLNSGSALGGQLPMSNMIPGVGAFNAMQSAITAAASSQQMSAMNMSTASSTAVSAVYNLAQACAEAANYIRANAGGSGDIVSELLGGGDSFWSADLGSGLTMNDVVDINALGIKPFATGGIVSAPTLAALRDGGQNEAVVPLPNGRAIPVEMTGNGQGAGDQSFTIINVLDKEVVNQMIAENPNTVLNVISADIIKGGPVSKAINIRRK